MASAQCQRPSEQTCQNKNTKEGHSFTEKVKEMMFHHKHPDHNNGQHMHVAHHDSHKTTDCKPVLAHSPNGAASHAGHHNSHKTTHSTTGAAATHGHHTNVTHHDSHKTTHNTTGVTATHGNGCAKIEKKKKETTEGHNGGVHCMPKLNKNMKKKKDRKASDGSSSSSSDSESDNDAKCCKKH